LDKDWSAPSNAKTATYGNIFEGKYTFKLKAKSPWNVWSEPLTYKLRILPPWYRTWLAYLVYASSALTILYTLYKWRTESLRRQKEQLQILYDATERFVPKAFLDLLKKNRIQDIQLGDSAEVELTALFSDIRGFTTLAEQLTPQEAFNFTNTYFKVMAPIIRSHNGFINQFHGDGIMALFPGNADDSIQAVQAMSKALDIFNKAQGTPIHVGYGLNTGMAVIGVLGEDERMEANVISDTINLASRTESLNKYYGTEFLLTDGTIKALVDKNKYRIRLVDKVHVKGKTKDTYLYEVNLNSGEDDEEIDFIKTYEDAFRLYEKGDIHRALEMFKKAQILRPENKSIRIFIARSEKLLQTSLPEDWNGVFEMSEK
jgi:two-component system sensor histidine kinase ChiS